MENKDRSSSDTPSVSPNKRLSLKEVMALRRSEAATELQGVVADPYEKAYSYKSLVRRGTGVACLPSKEHQNVWDPEHPESPDRIFKTNKRLAEMLIFQRTSVYPQESFDEEELILLCHTKEMLKEVKMMCSRNEESEAAGYDSIFYNGRETFKAAQKSVAECVNVAVQVAKNKIQNGFALVRPPGHHATKSTPNGYCFFNNIAIAAEYLLKNNFAKKILIIDFDVHHGQGTQQFFYERNDVLYFSIHRYEHGTFWPNLKESDVSFIGEGEGKGYNFNIPLNATGLKDEDYLAIVLNILLPLGYEYNPDMILVSAGYDACVGCPEGRMEVTPAFYGHLVTLISGLANGRIVCFLEGGYFPASLAEGIAWTIKGLLGEPCAPLERVTSIHPAVQATLNDVKFYMGPHWACFKTEMNEFEGSFNSEEQHVVVNKFWGVVEQPPFPTRNCYPVRPRVEHNLYMHKINYLRQMYENGPYTHGYIYDKTFLLHDNEEEGVAQEKPERLREIMTKLEEFKLLSRLKQFRIQNYGDVEYILKLHDKDYIDNLLSQNIPARHDLYFNRSTGECIKTCIRGLVTICDQISKRNSGAGVALLRPPGHHAKRDAGAGFCYVNNIVIAALYLIEKHQRKRVLIVDFDIHHGDGTQELTYEREDIMYISVHRFDDGKYFPSNPKADYNYIGTKKANGFNVNIPLNKEKMGDADYLAVWTKLVLPIAYMYNPDFVLVSAGFDAGINDPLGGYAVHPQTFGHLTLMLKPLAPMILVLEGGYQKETTALSMTMCIKALLGDPIPPPELGLVHNETLKTIDNVISVLRPFYPLLQVNKRICNKVFTPEDVELCQLKLTEKLVVE